MPEYSDTARQTNHLTRREHRAIPLIGRAVPPHPNPTNSQRVPSAQRSHHREIVRQMEHKPTHEGD